MEHGAETIEFGRTGLRVSALGVGTNTWGSRTGPDPDKHATFDAILDCGITLIDTAEVYGDSERTIGLCLRESVRRPVVLTKFAPYPWRLGKRALLSALRRSLSKLGVKEVDVYLLHFPFSLVSLETWADALADAVEAGLTRTVGISNCDLARTRRVHAALAARGIPLACNGVGFSLVQRGPERSGLLHACKELGVTLIAYQPPASGTLSGKYDSEHRLGGIRGQIYNRRYLIRIQPLVEVLKRIANVRGKTASQVALNWILCKGALPIPGAKSPE